jgi:hypothetical protein
MLGPLQSQLLSSDAEPIRSSYQVMKLNANFEYARSLLLQLEHESTAIKIASRKQAVQSDLLRKREIIKRLQARLQELSQLTHEDFEKTWSESEDEENDDARGRTYAPAAFHVNGGINTEPSAAQEAAANLSSTLRSRNPQAADSSNPISKATGTSLFPNTTTAATTAPSSPDPAVANRESLLTAHRAEQSQITDSLLTLAHELKMSAHGFHTSLESEKDILERAGSGLDKNIAGMDSAGKRMNVLRRMTEGRGLWGRLLLYAYIAVLWMVLLAVFMWLPKLRFSPGF